ncbi:acyltransferase family protein [Legionella sp. CNM-4043-24]|uniref:acyltransferase family protein n=1 Tax=Legionella sp. CNM-4043-24 TaxID=3421646 RepID=UPI00403ABB0C
MTRLRSLDVFRGITVAVMILVNSPGKLVAWPLLEHSDWNGCTLADLVFPFFIVMVGASSVLALNGMQQRGFARSELIKNIMLRGLNIFLIGLLLNAFPKHWNIFDLRLMGVLQRIALCYVATSLLYLSTSRRQQTGIIVFLLTAYWFLLSRFSLSMEDNLAIYIDRLILSPRHLYTPTLEPEGLLSTIPALASTLLGNLLGYCLISKLTREQQLRWILSMGVVLSVSGAVWSLFFPLNKALWTSSFVLWTAGLAFLSFAFCFVLVDMKQRTAWARPFELFGRNALLVYVLHVVFLKIQFAVKVTNAQGAAGNLKLYITDCLFGSLPPHLASFCYAVTYTLLWLLVLQVITLLRRKA